MKKEIKKEGNQRYIFSKDNALFGTPIKSVQTISEGIPYIDTGRGITAKTDIQHARMTDVIKTSINSTPLHVSGGVHYVNIGGCKWYVDRTGANSVEVNRAAWQVEVECSNIDAFIKAKQYTDLDINHYKPTLQKCEGYDTALSIYPRFILGTRILTSLITRTLCKVRSLNGIMQLLDQQYPHMIARTNYVRRYMNRAKFRTAVEEVIAAANKANVHISTIETISELFQVQSTTDGQNTTIFTNDVSPYPYKMDAADWKLLMEIKRESTPFSLIYNEQTINSIYNAMWDDKSVISKYITTQDDVWTQYVDGIMESAITGMKTLSIAIASLMSYYTPFESFLYVASEMLPNVSQKYDFRKVLSDRMFNDELVTPVQMMVKNINARKVVNDGYEVVKAFVPHIGLKPALPFHNNGWLVISNVSDQYTPYVDLDMTNMDILYTRPKKLTGNLKEMFKSTRVDEGANPLLYSVDTYIVTVKHTDGVYKIETTGDLGINLPNNLPFGEYYTNNVQWGVHHLLAMYFGFVIYTTDTAGKDNIIPVALDQWSGFADVSYSPIDAYVVEYAPRTWGFR